jgi:hypothetical protein
MLEMELKILRNLSHVLEESHQLHLATLFQTLQVKLQKALVTIDGVIGAKEEDPKRVSFRSLLRKKGDVKAMRLATGVKKSLDAMLVELAEWHRMLDPSWFLLALVQNPAVDSELTDQNASQNKAVSTLKSLRSAINRSAQPGANATSIFIPEASVLERKPILYFSGETGREYRTGKTVLVDNVIPNSAAHVNVLNKNVRDLARILSVVEPLKFGILACTGAIRVRDSARNILRFQVVFRVPENFHTPRSLRELLVTGVSAPLEERFRLAAQLARSVMFIHTADFVHKNIRPETIIVLKNDGSVIGMPFLMGFENFRPVEGNTFLASDSEWQKDLYRHPARQGPCLAEPYNMQHDIYSLGVCLLELGLWESFVLPDTRMAGRFYPAPNLSISQHLRLGRPSDKANKIKEELVDMARTRLPSKMGSRYTQIVLMCLGCLDAGDNGFGHESEFSDNDGILVGVRYIEKVSDYVAPIAVAIQRLILTMRYPDP